MSSHEPNWSMNLSIANNQIDINGNGFQCYCSFRFFDIIHLAVIPSKKLFSYAHYNLIIVLGMDVNQISTRNCRYISSLFVFGAPVAIATGEIWPSSLLSLLPLLS